MNKEEQELRTFYALKYGQGFDDLAHIDVELYLIMHFGSLHNAFIYFANMGQ